MTERQQAHLESRLLAERQRAWRLTGRVGLDPLLIGELAGILVGIDAALARIYGDADRFGHCGECGDLIPFERLDLMPWASRCPACEAGVERARARGAARAPRARATVRSPAEPAGVRWRLGLGHV